MSYVILVLGIFFLIYIKVRYGEAIDRLEKRLFDNSEPALYPVFDKGEVKELRQRLINANEEYARCSDDLFENENFNQNTSYIPTSEEAQIVENFFKSKYAAERAKKEYHFVIEGNAMVANSKATIQEISDQWMKLSMGRISDVTKVDEEAKSFIERLKNKKNSVTTVKTN